MELVRASDADYRDLLKATSVPVLSMLRVLQSKNGVHREEVEYANSILPNAGTYLSCGPGLGHFIRAEPGAQFTSSDVSAERELLVRLSKLLPEILRVLRCTDADRAGIVLDIVHDACREFSSIKDNGRSSANRKRMSAKLNRVGSVAGDLLRLVGDIELGLPDYVQRPYRRYRRKVHGEERSATATWLLDDQLRFLAAYTELEAHRTATGQGGMYVPGDQAKTHLVSEAYSLARYNLSPRYVTTPGSDFSFLCSLLYEVSTGVRDESLAGAINRFATSDERAEIDEHEAAFSEERDWQREEDNFLQVRESIERDTRRLEGLKTELRTADLSREARELVLIELEECEEKIDEHHRLHGPFLVWASQMKIDWASEAALLRETAALRAKTDIALGKRRRASES
ncbi:MAG: hypothetical protein AAFY73_15655 [Pseudomonadota bacterium]